MVGYMWNRVLLKLLIVAFFLIARPLASASIIDSKEIKIDFTKTNATSQCEWFPSERYSITKEGLGWGGPAEGKDARAQAAAGSLNISLNRGEILTRPVGIGLFWRPAQSARIRVELEPAPLEITNGDGKKFHLSSGQMFARHSPDLEHWTSWQRLSAFASGTNRIFEGDVGIPGRERARYESLCGEYGKRSDVAWSSDEEAVVRWILQKEPKFFAENAPFIGYVQVLFEGEFVAGHRFTEMRVQISYSLGGLHQPPPTKDLEEQMWTVPWRFKR